MITKRQQLEEQLEQRTPISRCVESKKKLVRLVKTCFDGLKTYGNSAEQLEACTMLMQMMLKDEPYELVKQAFEVHLRQSSEMPTPHEILANVNSLRMREKIDIAERYPLQAEAVPMHVRAGMSEEQYKRLEELRARDRNY